MKPFDDNQWTRREFTAQSVLAMLSGIAITISGCSDGNGSSSTSPTPAPTPAGPDDVVGMIGRNHGHAVVITRAQLDAGDALMNLDITGTADHTHSVSLTADEVGQIADGMRVQKTSTNNVAHVHTVTFN
jgi:hypothetical protein